MLVNVTDKASVNVTDFGNVIRLDINQLGALVPDNIGDKNIWGKAQNSAICKYLESISSAYGGNFSSFVEWTVTNGCLYDGADMRVMRREYFGDGYRAAITTCPWVEPDSKLGTRLQLVAYIPKSSEIDFEQKLWHPACHYECEQMALAPAVISRFGGAKQIFISGVVAWDKKDITPQFTEDPRKQIRYVLDRIENIFKEAGGSRQSVTRLRPFVHSAEITRILREEIADFWRDLPQPSVIIADEMSFGNPPSLFTEIQVSGITGDGNNEVAHSQISFPGNLETIIHVATARDYEMFQVAPIASKNAHSADAEVEDIFAQIDAIMQLLNLATDDLCLIFVYCDDAAALAKFEQKITVKFRHNQLHLVPCRKMQTIGNSHLQVELTARRLRQDNSNERHQ